MQVPLPVETRRGGAGWRPWAPGARRWLVLSVLVQLGLAFAFGHSLDARVFMATGYLVSHGLNPYAVADLSTVFGRGAFDLHSTVGYPPPWPLALGLLSAVYAAVPSLVLYNGVIKLPVIAANVVDEIEQVLRLGYERISFADDVFTMNRARVLAICAEIRRRDLRFDWECLARVDGFEPAIAREMRRAGCRRVFFGIESGNDEILRLMRKGITTAQARAAVLTAAAAGLETGAFFILCYPGETDDTVLETLRFATSLPLDYVGLTMPYPLPGTDLERRVGEGADRPWNPRRSPVLNQVLTYDGDFSARKMRFAIVKGHTQVMIRRRFGRLAPAALALVERPSDALFRRLR